MPEPPSDKPGRPWRGNREVLDAISGCCEQELPGGISQKSIHPIKLVIVVFGNGHRMERLKKFKWHSQECLKNEKKINMSECCIDAKFVPAKKGGTNVGPTKCGKGTKLVAITEKSGRPMSVLITKVIQFSIFLDFLKKKPRGRSDLPVAIFSQKHEKWLKLNNSV